MIRHLNRSGSAHLIWDEAIFIAMGIKQVLIELSIVALKHTEPPIH